MNGIPEIFWMVQIDPFRVIVKEWDVILVGNLLQYIVVVWADF